MATFGTPNPAIQAAAVEKTIAELEPRFSTRSKGDAISDPGEERRWHYWEHLGEISFPTRVMENVTSLVTFYPADVPKTSDGTDDPDRTTNGRVDQVWEAIGGSETVAGWVASNVVHQFVAGRAWMVPTVLDSDGSLTIAEFDDTDAEWRIMSTADLKDVGGLDKGGKPKVPGDRRLWQFYTPSKHRMSKPDSPVSHVATDCELLLTYKFDMLGHARSRAAAGIQLVPMAFQSAKDANGRTWGDQVMADLNSVRSNPQDPASHLPIFTFVKDTDEAAIFQNGRLSLADPNGTTDLLAKIESAVKSIAVGLDLPAEMLLGMGDLNHWSAWLIERQNFDHHLDPAIVRSLRDFTRWFRAVLEASGVPADVAANVMIWRNAETALTNPKHWEQAVDLWDRMLITDEDLRQAADVGEINAPNEDEVRKRILIKALASPQGLAAVPGIAEGSGLAPGGVEATPGVPQSTNPAESDDMPDVVQAATQTQLDRLGRRLARIDQTLIDRTERAVAREALRLSRQVKARIAAAARAAGRYGDVDDDTIAEQIGAAGVVALLSLADTADLIDPASINVDRVDDAIAEAQTATDTTLSKSGAATVQRDVRDNDRSTAVELVTAAVAAGVVASLFKRPRPSGETSIEGADLVPMADIRRALDRAGGDIAGRSVDGEQAWELIANGRHTVVSLDAAGIGTEAFRWVYGTTPRVTFEPHLNLDGEVFDRWDADVLRQDGTSGEWVGGDFYYPGDHRGCRCTYERVLAERTPPVRLVASA